LTIKGTEDDWGEDAPLQIGTFEEKEEAPALFYIHKVESPPSIVDQPIVATPDL
jgi:hypothetical protein